MIYLDNAATTKPCVTAISAANDCFENNFGNPSSLHNMGLKAEKILTETRKIIAENISCNPNSVFFTSGATESNNLAIHCAINRGKKKSKIVTTAIEHPSVSAPLKQLEKNFDIIKLNPNNFDLSCIDSETCLISVMLVNNETGHILPVRDIFRKAKRINPNIITHCDAVQGFMKISLKDLSADFITVSGHKIHGIKGAGALINVGNIHITPQIFGGGQENSRRSGTENVPAIAAMGAAVRFMGSAYKHDYITQLRKFLIENINRDYITVNSPDDGLPSIVNFSVKGIKSEVMLHFLEQKEIYVSSGSACSKSKKSEVLQAYGVKESDSAIRVSFSYETSQNEIKDLAAAIDEGYKTLLKVG